MPTVIDELIVTLGLDPKAYNKGSRDVEASLAKSKEASRTSTRDIESQNKRAGESFSKLKNEAVGLFLTFAGAGSVASFVSHIIGADAATGKLATGLGIATRELSAWEQATASAGGAAGDADAALNKLSNLYFRFRTGQVSGEEQAGLFGLGIFDPEKLGKGTDGLLALAEAADRFKAQGKIPEFRQRMLQLGIPDGMITALEKGKDGFKALVDQKYRDTAITKSDAERSQELLNALEDLTQSLQKGARALYPFVAQLTSVVHWFDKSGAAGPVAASAIAAVGVAAAVAVGPWGLLAAGIAAAFAALNDFVLHSPQLISALDRLEAPLKKILPAWLFDRNIFGGAANSAPATQGGSDAAGTGGKGSNAAFFAANGYTDAQARGIAAGLYSENTTGALGMAANGAFGIAQWRAGRREQLFAFAGTRKPNLDQQRRFILWELQHSERGAASAIKSAKTDSGAAYAYISRFERPDLPGHDDQTRADLGRANHFLGHGRAAGAAKRAAGAAPAAAGPSSVAIGTIVVHTASTDAPGLAKDLRGALAQRMSTLQANRGLE